MPAPTGTVISGHPFDFAQTEHDKPSRNWKGRCGEFTRTAFAQPSVGDFDGDGAADAEDQWKAAKHPHPETDPTLIPRGVPVYWLGGSSDNGHATVSRGDGTVWGTDLVRPGQVDVYPIADVHTRWGLTLVGWTEDIGGHRVWLPDPIAPPKPRPSRPNIDTAQSALRKARQASKPGSWARRAIDRARAALKGFQ